MRSVFAAIVEESRRVLPAVVYFFLAFTLFNLTFGEWMATLGIRAMSLGGILIGSLVVGKVMMIVDHLPFLNCFRDRPLIYNTLWKTCIYTLASFFFRVVEHLSPLVVKYGSLQEGAAALLDEVFWPRFWTIQVWFFVLFLIFVVNQQLVVHIGSHRLREIFLGRSGK